MLRYKNALAAAVASVLIGGFVMNASALSPEVRTERQSVRDALTLGVAETAVFDGVSGQFRADGIPSALFAPDFTARPASRREMTLEYLAARGEALGLDAQAVANLAVTSERLVDGIGVVRVQQRQQDLPVYGSDIVVTTAADGRVIFVSNGVVSHVADVDTTPKVDAARAIAAAKTYLGGQELRHSKTELMVHVANGVTHLVWRTDATSTDVGVGGWELLVDAHSGAVLRAQSTTHNIDGTGTVFKPDPLSSARASASDPGYADNNNADSPQFTAQLFPVTLRDITLSGGQHSLNGPKAVCWQWEPPNDAACPVQASSNFSVTRSALTFDAVNVYYHVDTFMRYINTTLGVAVTPRQYTGGVRYDAHGENGADNSHFDSGNGELVFGEGDVDDAQDADVIIHELGHGIHDWVTNGGLSQTQGLSEGVGDYLAQAYSRDFPNQWTPADAAYNWVFNFDGHSPLLWAGRVTNWHIGHSYPNNLGSPAPHIPGQYWASCNIVARDAVGGPLMDKAFLVGLSATNGSANQKTAAQAVINAAAAIGANATQIAAIGAAYNTSCTYAVTVPAAVDLIYKNGFES